MGTVLRCCRRGASDRQCWEAYWYASVQLAWPGALTPETEELVQARLSESLCNLLRTGKLYHVAGYGSQSRAARQSLPRAAKQAEAWGLDQDSHFWGPGLLLLQGAPDCTRQLCTVCWFWRAATAFEPIQPF